jgi:flagellar basal-body rod protein FlgB
MFGSMIQSTSIPVLEQVVGFAQARHTVLAGNIANLDTPGYRVRDLSEEDFQARLREALRSRDQMPPISSPGDPYPQQQTMLAEVSQDSETILYHDDSNVGIEYQVTEMVKNQLQHNLALSIMTSQFRLLQLAIGERL